jgi:hypothetical protein
MGRDDTLYLTIDPLPDFIDDKSQVIHKAGGKAWGSGCGEVAVALSIAEVYHDYNLSRER